MPLGLDAASNGMGAVAGAFASGIGTGVVVATFVAGGLVVAAEFAGGGTAPASAGSGGELDGTLAVVVPAGTFVPGAAEFGVGPPFVVEV